MSPAIQWQMIVMNNIKLITEYSLFQVSQINIPISYLLIVSKRMRDLWHRETGGGEQTLVCV